MNVVVAPGTSAAPPQSLQTLHGKRQQSHGSGYEKITSFSGLWDSSEASITPLRSLMPTQKYLAGQAYWYFCNCISEINFLLLRVMRTRQQQN